MTMTDQTGKEYTPLLGSITDTQLQAALERFQLGDFVEAEPIPTGFGQNIFLTSTTGQYVLRGCPHWEAQFRKEQFLANLLHERTTTPVAWPYLMDYTTDLFGWSYIVMPRVPGTHEQRDWPAEDQVAVARAVATNLLAMQELTWPFAGDYELAAGTVLPFPNGLEGLVGHAQGLLEHSRGESPQTTPADEEWVAEIIAGAWEALHEPFQPCFVMNDYKTGNFAVSRVEGRWKVTGIFDLAEGYFGNGEADLVRQVSHYLHFDDVALAKCFLTTYLEAKPPQPGFRERFAFFMLRDRLIYWDFGTSLGRHWFDGSLTFRKYAERNVSALSLILPEMQSG